jgi:predicted O-methyltransferase YrrM
MHHIRPYKLFTALESPPAERVVQAALPFRRAAGGLTLLEMFVAIAANRIVQAKQVFEIGTFLGSTTLNLALNIPDDGTVYTLDLDKECAADAKQDVADAPLTEIHLASRSSLDFAGSAVESKIRTLTGDSTKFDFSRWNGSIDLVFIDGGHDVATVTSDTENALQIARKDKASCVLWHDYRNRDYSGLTYYLDQLSRQIPLVHIEDTMLCAWFNDPDRSIWPRLLGN